MASLVFLALVASTSLAVEMNYMNSTNFYTHLDESHGDWLIAACNGRARSCQQYNETWKAFADEIGVEFHFGFFNTYGADSIRKHFAIKANPTIMLINNNTNTFYKMDKKTKELEEIKNFYLTGYLELDPTPVPPEETWMDFAKLVGWALIEGVYRGHLVALKEAGLGDQPWPVKASVVLAFYGLPFVLVYWLKVTFDHDKDE